MSEIAKRNKSEKLLTIFQNKWVCGMQHFATTQIYFLTILATVKLIAAKLMS
jgi:hypothetical protein